jgi:L-phenylalanine/L-methionine N-acetyltransferase
MNVQIRHATPADYEAVSRIFSGPNAIQGTFQLPFTSPEVWRKRLSEPEAGHVVLLGCREGDVVGMLGLHTQLQTPRRAHAASIGMAVRDDWQGKGIGTALMKAALELADQWLNLSRLELNVFTDNEPAVRFYQKFGFEIEGTLRQFAFRDGRFVDAYTMGRLRAGHARASS